jgi:hypothetical protein
MDEVQVQIPGQEAAIDEMGPSEGVELDAVGKPVFRDAVGERLQAWQVPLDEYTRVHEELGFKGDWAAVHQTVVARARIHGIAVEPYVLVGHDGALLEAVATVERKMHGGFPNRYCPLCTDGGEDSGE